MSDYHERFRERFSNVVQMTVIGMSAGYKNVSGDILAFIDEVEKESIKFGYDNGMQDGKARERAALIEKVEGMKKPPGMIDRTFGYNEAIHHILSYLQEPDASQGCCCHCHHSRSVECLPSCVNGACFCPARHSPQGEAKPSPLVGCCEDCAYYLDYKDDWQCNGGAMSERCKCHPDVPKDAPQGDKAEGV